MKKRLMSLLLTVAMVMSMVVVPAAAADPLTLTLSSTSGKPGEQITVTVDASGLTTSDPVGVVDYNLKYDSQYLVLDESASSIGGSWVGGSNMFGFSNKGTYVYCTCIADDKGFTTDATIGKLVFNVKSDIDVPEVLFELDDIYIEMADFSEGSATSNSVSSTIIYPINVTVDIEQTAANKATLTAAATPIEGTDVTAGEVSIAWGTTPEMTNSAASGASIEAASGSTIYYQASCVGSDGVTYRSATKEFTMEPAAAKAVTISGADEITVTKDPSTTTYTASVTDQFGDAFTIDPSKLSFKLDAEYKGVSIDAATGALTVTNETDTCTVTINAIYDGIESTTGKTVQITRPDATVEVINIWAKDESQLPIILPALGAEDVVVKFENIVLDNLGMAMPVSPEWSVESAPAGITMENGVLTVTDEAKFDGERIEILVYASLAGVDSNKIPVTIRKAGSIATTVVMPDDTTMTIPTNDTPNTKTFAAVVYDQYGDVMEAEVAYTFATADEFVTVSGNTVTVVKGAEKNKTYTLTATCNGKSDSMEIKAVDIEIEWGTITVDANAVYGMTWNKIVTVAPGTAKLEGQDVPGTWTVANADVIPNAGEQTFTVEFNGELNGNEYKVTTTGTATIAQKEITATWSGFSGLIYSGEKVNVTASVAVDGVNVTVTGGDAVDAGENYTATATLDNANYKLSNPEQAYSIAKADIPTFAGATAQQISVKKIGNINNVIALIADEVEAYGFAEDKLTGTITIDRDISEFGPGSILNIDAVFTPNNKNYNAYTFSFELEITEGDPQTIVIADEFHTTEFTYGDAAIDLKQYITVKRGENVVADPSFTFVVDPFFTEPAVSVDANGMVTILKSDMVTINVVAIGDDDWADKPFDMTLFVSPKTLSVDPATIGAITKVYDGTNYIEAEAVMVNAKLLDIVGEDEVALDLENAYASFEGTDAGENIPVVIDSIALKGTAAGNYTIDAIEGLTGTIAKADPTFIFSNLEQYASSITEVTAVIEPTSFDADWNLLTPVIAYEIPAVEAVPCDHEPTEEEPTCDHTDGCAYVEAKDAYWTNDIANLPKVAGTYRVKASTAGDSNVNAGEQITELKISASMAGGGGGAVLTSPVTTEKCENGSISTSPKYAAKGKEVTINVKPDAGYELKSITVTDTKGNNIAVTNKNGKYTFVMPATKVTIKAEFAEIAKECASDKFVDLDANAWYHDAVDSMVEKNLMSGVSADKFAPEMNLTRGMIVQILWAMEGKPVVNYAMSFKDVSADAWYAEAVRWAASTGITSGYSADAFGPNDYVTREQLAAMLFSYARIKGADLSVGENTNILSYNDAFSISAWAYPAMQWACGEGLISGTPAGDLMPVAVASRAQVAVILNNFYNLING